MLRRGIDIRALVDIWCRSYQKPPRFVVLDIDDTTTLIRSHQLPLAAGQPDAAHPAHRCLLAATRPACCNPELESAAAHRVRYDPPASLENRRTFHRAREPHSYRARLMLHGGRDVQSCRAQAATVWTISQRGDDAPPSPDPFTPNASTASSTQPICRAWRAQNGRACLAKTGLQIMRPRA